MPHATRSLPATFGSLDEVSLGLLLTYRKVFETGSYRAAGFELGDKAKGIALDAATVKRRIETLEKHLGGRLFEPDGSRGMTPTELAHKIRGHVRQIIFIAEQLYRKVDDRQVVLGFHHTITARQHAVLINLMNLHADEQLQFHVRTGCCDDLLKGVLEGEIDVAIVMWEALGRMTLPGIAKVTEGAQAGKASRVFVESCLALVSETHPAAGGNSISADALMKEPMISFESKDMPAMVKDFAEYLGHYLPRHEADTWETMVSLVLGNHGVALVPKALETYKVAGIKALTISARSDRPVWTFPPWKYAIVRHESNSRQDILKLEEEIATVATNRFRIPPPKRAASRTSE